jgi:alkylhydroperoxidase family enzyme
VLSFPKQPEYLTGMPLKSKQPRIPPLEPPLDDDAAAAVDLLGPPIQLFRVLARRPELARGVAGWGRYYFSRRAALTVRQRELVIDRTAARCGADYEWGVHIAAFADKGGLTDRQIASLSAGSPADDCWEAGDRALLRAVDELHTSYDLSDEAWTDLVDAVGGDGALDTILVCGWYHAISFAVRALRLPLEPGTAGLDSAR